MPELVLLFGMKRTFSSYRPRRTVRHVNSSTPEADGTDRSGARVELDRSRFRTARGGNDRPTENAMRTESGVAIDGPCLGAPASSRREAAASRALAGVWRLDPTRSNVEFRVGHFWGLVKVSGRFDGYHGTLDLSADPAVELTIDASSVQTGNDKRDRHLRSADFFDVEEHPYVRFVSDSAGFDGKTELGMTWNKLGMISPRSLLAIRGRLVRDATWSASHSRSDV